MSNYLVALSNKSLPISGVFKNKLLFFVFERAAEVEGICFHLARQLETEENSSAECAGAARSLGQGDSSRPRDLLSEVTWQWCLRCHEILNGFYTCATYSKELGKMSAHLPTCG